MDLLNRKELLGSSEGQSESGGELVESEASRSWGSWVFDVLTKIEPDLAADGRPLTFEPASRYERADTVHLHRYGSGPFCRFNLRDLPATAGVYVVTASEIPTYVGKCQSVAQRWGLRGYGSIQPRNCYSKGQETNCRINNLILDAINSGKEIHLWFHPTPNRMRWRRPSSDG